MEENKEELQEKIKTEKLDNEVQEQKEETTQTVRISEVVGENNSIRKNNTAGLVSFIFSLIGIFIMGIPCGIVAVITGIVGIATFKKEEEKNKWMAITGLCVGIADIVLVLFNLITIYTMALY